ncbi:MAG TPA: SIS domain-containing protein, partial [Ignisphaera sp.]|nr:SIS domain-containing protein [Ignisphaera sp.]
LRAVSKVSRILEGFYTFAVLDAESRSIAVYTSLQPIYIGVSRDLVIVSSSRYALYGYTDRVSELRADEIAILSSEGVEVYRASDLKPVDKVFEDLKIDPSYILKDGYPHHMLREIYEIPYSILRTLSAVQEKYLSFASRLLQGAKDIYVIADGTSLHAGFVGSYYLSELAHVSPIVVSAAEFPLYYVENVGPGSLVIAISQSGETGDVIRSVYEAKLRGATILGITNYVGSRLANLSNLYLPMAAGPELAVPATKTFVSTLVLLYLAALRVARDIGKITASEYREKVLRLKSYALGLRGYMPRIDRTASEAAKNIATCRSGYVVSRGITYPIAMEGALKLKEAAYVHAEGMEAGEFKHGPIVLVEKGFFTIFIVPVERMSAEATYPLIRMAREKEATVVAIGFEGDENLKSIEAITTITVPPADRHVAPIALTIPIQFVAYRLGELLKRPIDSPRYLTKAVIQ